MDLGSFSLVKSYPEKDTFEQIVLQSTKQGKELASIAVPELSAQFAGVVGKHGSIYPDMPWEPKESFKAVADYYARHLGGCMNLKGVCYDAGSYMAFNWRPHFEATVVKRELEIIKADLHCNAVRISGLDIKRLVFASESALDAGLEVWFSPQLWDKRPDKTLKYIVEAAAAAQTLNQQFPNRVVFSVGSESTLFMRGILPGKNFAARIRNPRLMSAIRAGEHNKPLNAYLAQANKAVRQVFSGKVTYASLVWEAVDWSLFDYVGVDHYRIARIADKYVEMLKPAFDQGKPVVVTEFGYSTCQRGIGSEGFLSTAGLGESIIDFKSQFFHQIPIFGRFVHPRVRGNCVRDENWQARQLVDNLSVLDHAGVDGAFISQFISQITPYSDNPKYDIDMASASLVKYYDDGKHGATYPDMPWEPKESFRAVADYYGTH